MTPSQANTQVRSGFYTLLYKELLRFWRVGFQTIAAPVITALLYLIVFAQVLQGRVQVYGEIPYTTFLIPGLMMMSMLQNAFANKAQSGRGLQSTSIQAHEIHHNCDCFSRQQASKQSSRSSPQTHTHTHHTHTHTHTHNV